MTAINDRLVPPVSKDIYHRPAYSLDMIATLCQGCDGYWPCELAGHTGFWWYVGDPDEDEWQWVCHDCCPHESCNRDHS